MISPILYGIIRTRQKQNKAKQNKPNRVRTKHLAGETCQTPRRSVSRFLFASLADYYVTATFPDWSLSRQWQSSPTPRAWLERYSRFRGNLDATKCHCLHTVKPALTYPHRTLPHLNKCREGRSISCWNRKLTNDE